MLLATCRSERPGVEPTIQFTRLPPAGAGNPEKLDPIEGRVTGAHPGQQIVLFARSGRWWVQPFDQQPFTSIQSDSTWKNSTHPGSGYAALLVNAGFRPPRTMKALPEKGDAVLAVASVEGALLQRSPGKTLSFSGYEWEVRQTVSDAGGSRNVYDPANAWVDNSGFLHLRIGRDGSGWTSGEVNLTRSLGYGSYRFVIRDIALLEPAEILAISTWDDSGPAREMNIEIGRWGEPGTKNVQYVVQPYYVPANVVRFLAPPGIHTFSFNWEPGRVAFRTVRGSGSILKTNAVAEHVFTSGVPSSGNELIHINHYVFQNRRNPLQHGSEVVIEKFEYLP
jgi:hypothetical protein